MRLPGPWVDWLPYNKSGGPLSQIRKKVVVDPIPDKLLDTHTRPDMEYRPQRTGPPEIPKHERNAYSLSSESENYHIFLQGQSKTLSLYVLGKACAFPKCKYTELNRITTDFLPFCPPTSLVSR